MRTRMAILVSGVQVELREVVLRNKPQEMIGISPKATVPVLQLPNGQVIDESLDIMRWALTHGDPEGWLDHVDDQLIATNDGPFKAALDRYKYPARLGLENGEAYRDAAIAHLVDLDARLHKAPFLGGQRLRFTDAALFPFVRQFAATDQRWFDAQDWSALQRWLHAISGSEMFMTIMARYPAWKSSDPQVNFPPTNVMPAKAGI
jgi:glutathione S-transferase